MKYALSIDRQVLALLIIVCQSSQSVFAARANFAAAGTNPDNATATLYRGYVEKTKAMLDRLNAVQVTLYEQDAGSPSS